MADTIEQQSEELVKQFWIQLAILDLANISASAIKRLSNQCAILHCELRLKSFPDSKGTSDEMESYIQAEIGHYQAIINAINALK